MSVAEMIREFKAMPDGERAEVAKFIMEQDDSWIPMSFKEGIEDIKAGRVTDLDEALKELGEA